MLAFFLIPIKHEISAMNSKLNLQKNFIIHDKTKAQILNSKDLHIKFQNNTQPQSPTLPIIIPDNPTPTCYCQKDPNLMQVKKLIDSSYKIGEIVYSAQNEKYQILQKITSPKKPLQQSSHSLYEHIDTFIAKKLSNKLYYILKKYELSFLDKTPSAKELSSQSPNKEKGLIKEIKSKLLHHPNLLQIEDVFFEKNSKQPAQKSRYLIIIEEYCEQGDLAYFIRNETKKTIKQNKKQFLTQKIIAKWLLQILLALQHLHFSKLTHQVLNPNNIYLTPLGNLKLNEFYLLNSITCPKETKKSKQTLTTILDGYEPMLHEKKFKINEKKDIHDFGLLISYLCNLGEKKEVKKEPKSKSISHLPSPFSQELDNIYLNCINVKKTALQVKDILKTPYFLSVMRDFISDKKLNVPVFDKIPIKKYMIHKKTISPKTIKTKKKENEKLEPEVNEGKLPKIEKGNKLNSQTKNSAKNLDKYEKKNQISAEEKKAMRASLQKLKKRMEINQKQKLSREKRVRKNSAQKDKIEKVNQAKQKPKVLTPISSSKGSTKNNSLLPPPPTLFKNKKTDSKSREETTESQPTGTKSSRQQNRSRQGQKIDNISRSQSNSPQKTSIKAEEFKLTPDITFGKKSVQNQPNPGEAPGLLKLEPSPRTQGSYQMMQSKESQLAKISQNLAKIFSDLKIREDDDQELSFEMNEQEEEELRLTLKEQKQAIEGEQNLMKTYKGKFDQIICELQQKYQPNLQTIIEKTMEWDSNDFFTNRDLLMKLKSEENQSLLPSSAFIEEQILQDPQIKDQCDQKEESQG